MAERPVDEALEASTTRWMAAGLVLMVLFAAAFPVYRLLEPGTREGAGRDLATSLAAQGRNLYQIECASCHGIRDEVGSAPVLNSKQFLESATDTQIEQLIAVGIPGSAMAAYALDYGGTLTSAQIRAVTTYLRGLEATAPDLANWRTP